MDMRDEIAHMAAEQAEEFRQWRAGCDSINERLRDLGRKPINFDPTGEMERLEASMIEIASESNRSE